MNFTRLTTTCLLVFLWFFGTIGPAYAAVPLFSEDSPVKLGPPLGGTDIEPSRVLSSPPVAVPDTFPCQMNEPIAFLAFGNDSDPDGDLNEASLVILTSPINGLVSVDFTGMGTYAPNSMFLGLDSMIYAIYDLLGNGDTSVIYINVLPNSAPLAVNDAMSLPQGSDICIAPMDNDYDPDFDAISINSIPQNGGLGSAVITGDSICYTPLPGANGIDSILYEICDGGGLCNVGWIFINVLPVTTPPVAVQDIYQVIVDSLVYVCVWSNDSDIDGFIVPGSVLILDSTDHGQLSLDPLDGCVLYIPVGGYSGIDNFYYSVSDDDGLRDSALVVFSIGFGLDFPVAVDDTVYTPEDTPINIAVLQNDVVPQMDIGSVSVLMGSGHGTISVDALIGDIAYIPGLNFTGLDSFSYVVYDSIGLVSNVATVLIYVGINGNETMASDDIYLVPEDDSIWCGPLMNDINTVGPLDVSSLSILVPPSFGGLVVNPVSGNCQYIPDPDFCGLDSASYSICGPLGVCDTAFMYFTVQCVNDPPVTMDDFETTIEDQAIWIQVLSNDYDPDQNIDSSSISVVMQPQHGSIILDPVTGQLEYTPDVDFNGQDSFQYMISDLVGGSSAPGWVYLTVFSENDAPFAQSEVVSTAELTPVDINVLFNDTDVDGTLDLGSVTVTSAPTNGSYVIDPGTGIITYTPDVGFSGVDSLYYTLQDDSGAASNAAIVYINVSDVDISPVAIGDSVSGNEDELLIIDLLANDYDSDGHIDTASIVVVTSPVNGTVSIDLLTGQAHYSPNSDYDGLDFFSYYVQDDQGFYSNVANVLISLNPVNDPPETEDDAYSTYEDLPINLPVISNDADPDGALDPGSVTVISGPFFGTIEIDSITGHISYTPNPDFNGTDSFYYYLNDLDSLGSDTALVVIQVQPVTDPPLAIHDTLTGYVNTDLDFSIHLNDLDPDGNLDPGSIVFITTPGSGTISLDTLTGEITFSPDTNFVGVTNFFYIIFDSTGQGSNMATVYINIEYPGQLVGYVFNDLNGNCQMDVGEEPLSNWNVSSTGPETYYGNTDASGFFSNPVVLGNYSFAATPPVSPFYWAYWELSGCAAPAVSGQINTPGEVDSIFIPFQEAIQCPIMTVDISAPFIRRCFNNYYTVNYSNQGTMDAANSIVTVELDPEMTVTSTSLPFILPQIGDVYQFDVGAVSAGQSGSISITCSLSCNPLLGEAICVEASISPDSICFPPYPTWDFSSLDLELECLGDTSVGIKIYNNGSGDMLTPGPVIVVIDDNILRLDTTIQLLSGGLFSVNQPADGSTYFVKAQQSPGHPGNSNPMMALEGCGTDSLGGFSTGFLTDYPQDDASPFVSIDCQEVMGAWDPNDKYAYPAGLTEENLIESGQELEYRIRFQNTGTDTAFNVYILDTLDPGLDPATVVPGVSSHPYTFELLGQGIFRFNFDNIMLVDSFANEPGSHGFVKFKVQQEPNLQVGTTIENSAAIYFDFNEAVITNTTFNTIGEDFRSLLVLDVRMEEQNPVSVYPNPFKNHTTIDFLGGYYSEINLDIMDLQGKTVQQETYNNVEKLKIDTEGLERGIYLFRLSNEEGVLGSGKLIKN